MTVIKSVDTNLIVSEFGIVVEVNSEKSLKAKLPILVT